MTSGNNEGEKNFEKLTAGLTIAQLLAMNIVAPSPQPNVTNRPNYTDYSAVQKQQPKFCPINKEPENDSEAQNYESLPGIARLSNLTEQLEQVAELQTGEDKEKREKDWEISFQERNRAKSSGSPDPDPESEESEYVSEYMNDLKSRLETGTLTLKSPEEKSESELRESETESESSESEAESEGEYVSEYMKDLESRLETGTLTLKSPEEQSESEFSESETKSESESSESETESESESHSEMKWG
jgi:hypothetical protein